MKPADPTTNVQQIAGAAYTTRQASRCINASVEAMRAQVQRTGSFRGIAPAKTPKGRLLWPRDQVLRLARQHLANRKVTIDLRATLPFLSNRSLLESDPAIEAAAIALCDPRDDDTLPVAYHLDDTHALRDWNRSQVQRLTAAQRRMSAEQRDDAMRLLARAIAPAVAFIPDDVLANAVRLYVGEGA